MTNLEDEPQISNVAPLGRLRLAPNSSETLAALAMRKSQSRCGSGRLWHSRNTDWPTPERAPCQLQCHNLRGRERGSVCNIVAIWIFALCHWNGLFGNSTVFLLPRLFACNFHRLLLSTLPVPLSSLLLLPLRRKVQINLWRPTVTFLAPLSLCCHYSCTLSAAWDLPLWFSSTSSSSSSSRAILTLSHFPKNSEMWLVIAFENRIR